MTILGTIHTVDELRELVDRADWRVRQNDQILGKVTPPTEVKFKKDPTLWHDWVAFREKWDAALERARTFIQRDVGKFGELPPEITPAEEEYQRILDVVGHGENHKLGGLQRRIYVISDGMAFDPMPQFYDATDFDMMLLRKANKITRTIEDIPKNTASFIEQHWGKMLLTAGAVGVGYYYLTKREDQVIVVQVKPEPPATPPTTDDDINEEK